LAAPLAPESCAEAATAETPATIKAAAMGARNGRRMAAIRAESREALSFQRKCRFGKRHRRCAAIRSPQSITLTAFNRFLR
jgi:hypothetical protein